MLHTLQSSGSPRRKNLGKPWKSGMSNMESSSSFKPCIAGSVPYLERNAFRVSSRGNILLKVEFGRGKQNPSKCFVLLVLIYTNSTQHTTWGPPLPSAAWLDFSYKFYFIIFVLSFMLSVWKYAIYQFNCQYLIPFVRVFRRARDDDDDLSVWSGDQSPEISESVRPVRLLLLKLWVFQWKSKWRPFSGGGSSTGDGRVWDFTFG